MEIDWVNLLATITAWSVAFSAVVGAGSFVTSRILAARARVRK
jgi:hypothetical protein